MLLYNWVFVHYRMLAVHCQSSPVRKRCLLSNVQSHASQRCRQRSTGWKEIGALHSTCQYQLHIQWFCVTFQRSIVLCFGRALDLLYEQYFIQNCAIFYFAVLYSIFLQDEMTCKFSIPMKCIQLFECNFNLFIYQMYKGHLGELYLPNRQNIIQDKRNSIHPIYHFENDLSY